MTLSETIELIEKAMEGVTPGPWLTYGAVLGHKGDVFAPTAKRVTDCHHIARCFAPKPEKPIICELQAIHAAREAVTISEANAAYIAACSPDRMREVLAAAREADVLKREVAEKDARIADLEEALKPVADKYTDITPTAQDASWQSIETAPKDWTNIILFDAERDPEVFEGYFSMEDGGRNCWMENQGMGSEPVNPSRWMPLPASPAPNTKGNGCE